MTQGPRNLVWIDLEMTGLDPDSDHIIEIATIITDGQLNILAEGPVVAIRQPEEYLEAMDEWNQRHRAVRSGRSCAGIRDRRACGRVADT